MYKKNADKPSEGQRSLRKAELRIESSEPEAVRDEVDGIVSNYDKTGILPLNPPPKWDNKNTPPSLERGAEEPFEIDVTSLAAKLGRNIARLIAKGIVQDHYDGDWSRVRFIGLGEEINKTRLLPLNPPPEGTLREESSPLIPLRRGTMEAVA